MVHSLRSLLSGNNRTNDITHVYESAKGLNFALPFDEHYQSGPAGVAHTRSLAFLKKHLGGPYFDLEAIWDEHTLYEFGERNVEKTMETMVAEPYVNHVPTVRSCRPSYHLWLFSVEYTNTRGLDDRGNR